MNNTHTFYHANKCILFYCLNSLVKVLDSCSTLDVFPTILVALHSASILLEPNSCQAVFSHLHCSHSSFFFILFSHPLPRQPPGVFQEAFFDLVPSRPTYCRRTSRRRFPISGGNARADIRGPRRRRARAPGAAGAGTIVHTGTGRAGNSAAPIRRTGASGALHPRAWQSGARLAWTGACCAHLECALAQNWLQTLQAHSRSLLRARVSVSSEIKYFPEGC